MDTRARYGSVTPVDDTMRCPCGGVFVAVDLLVDGQELIMRSCADCETRRWHRDGEPVPFAALLADLTDADTRYRRQIWAGARSAGGPR